MTTTNKKKSLLPPLLLILIGLVLVYQFKAKEILTKGSIQVKIEPAVTIMPAAYKVYANENALGGKYNLFKMLVTNSGDHNVRNIDVSYEIPGYIPMTNIQKIPELPPGQSAVVLCFPKFNPDIVNKNSGSKETVNISITGANINTLTRTFQIDIKGRNELQYTSIPINQINSFSDNFDNLDLAACFVTPNDPIIKYYTQQIQEKILKGETASVTNSLDEGVRFLKGIYDATLMSHTVYSGTSGVPTFENGVESMVQTIRLPREVVTGKTGLCIELSLLYASVMMNAGLDPIIFVVPGHAYPGFAMNGQLVAIEATGIGGEGLHQMKSADEALQIGFQSLQTFLQNTQSGDERFKILHIRSLVAKGVSPMELKDDAFLRQKIDEIAKTFVPKNEFTTPSANAPTNYSRFDNGGIAFSYPAHWEVMNRSENLMLQNLTTIGDRSNHFLARVFGFIGESTPEKVMNKIKLTLLLDKQNMEYENIGEKNGFTIFKGTTKEDNKELAWIGAFKGDNLTTTGITISLPIEKSTANLDIINNILNSLK